MIRAAAAAAVGFGFASHASAQYEAPLATYNAPASYYSRATGATGATLKAQLNDIIDEHVIGGETFSGHILRSYSSSGGDNALLKLDQDPGNASNVKLVYSGVSVAKSAVLNTTYNREHLWPNSYGMDDDNPAYSDLFNLRVCDANVNSDRNNNYYDNGGTVAHPEAPECLEVEGVSWEPRAVEKGDIARSMFYVDTRYEGNENDNFPRNLQLVGTGQLNTVNGNNNNMGNLDTLLRWHYQDGVSNAERRRNHLIYTNDTSANGWGGNAYNQGNRNPFVDHPEWVWAVFGGGNNNSRIHAGPTPNADGSSAPTVNLRVMKNGTWGTGAVNLTKLGSNPTTYDVTASGNVVTTAKGTGQTFDINTQARSITVGLTGSTAVAGAQTGTLTIDNTDITTSGAGNTGSADGNDVVTILGQVVENRVITASSVSFNRVVVGSSVSAPTSLASPGSDDANTRVTVLGTGVAADANGVAIAAGGNRTYNGTNTTGTRTVSANFATPGEKSGSRSFNLQGEGLAGETVLPVSVSYTATALDHAQPSFAAGSVEAAKAVDFGYVPAGFAARSETIEAHNNPSAAGALLTAGLDVDGASVTAGGSPRLSTDVVASDPAQPLAAGAAPRTYAVTFAPDAATATEDSTTFAIAVSDENIPGGTARPSLNVTATGRTFTDATFPASGFVKLLAGETLNTGPLAVGDNVTLAKRGPGAMNITGPQSNGGQSELVVEEGQVHLATDAGSPASAPLKLTVNGAAGSATLGSTQHLRALALTSGGSASVQPGGGHAIVTGAIEITGPGSRLDVADSNLIVRGGDAGSWSGTGYTGIAGLVAAGRADGNWTGAGILTSQSDADTGLTSLAVALASETARADGALAGESVAASDVLVMYTYGGDADLSGSLDSDDYFAIDSNFNLSGSVFGYTKGDFDYNGAIDSDDYFILDSNFNNQILGTLGGAPSAAATVAVPEPASLALLAAAAALPLRRRRRGTA